MVCKKVNCVLVLLTSLLLIGVFGACKLQTRDKKIAETKSITIGKPRSTASKGLAYNVESVIIKKDEIIFSVDYLGGCIEQAFELMWDETYLKSIPPQVILYLDHDAKNDTCKKKIKKDIKFDLRKIQYKSRNEVIVKYGKEELPYKY